MNNKQLGRKLLEIEAKLDGNQCQMIEPCTFEGCIDGYNHLSNGDEVECEFCDGKGFISTPHVPEMDQKAIHDLHDHIAKVEEKLDLFNNLFKEVLEKYDEIPHKSLWQRIKSKLS